MKGWVDWEKKGKLQRILVKAGNVVWKMANLKILICVTISLKRGKRAGLIG